MFEGFFPFVRRPVWTIDLSQTLWEVLDIKSELEGGEDVLSSSGNSCPTMYCGTRSLINDILRSGGGEARTRRKQNCDFTRWLSLSLNSWSSFHLGCCHLFYIHATAQWYRCQLGCSCSQNLPGSNYRRIICSCSYYMEHAKILL